MLVRYVKIKQKEKLIEKSASSGRNMIKWQEKIDELPKTLKIDLVDPTA